MIKLRTLGGVDLQISESDSTRAIAAQPKRLALLVYLALDESTGFRRRDSAVGYLWPELDTLHARGALRQALHSLRKLLGERALITRGEEEIGVSQDVVQCDAVEFRDAIDQKDYEKALDLYCGDFLDGFFVSDVAPEFDQWISNTRSDLRRRAALAAWELAGCRRKLGDLGGASALARRAASLAVDDENAAARLISFLDDIGDRVGALEAYDALSKRLKTEYESEPSPETQALISRVRSRTFPSMHRASATVGSIASSVADTNAVEPSHGQAPVARTTPVARASAAGDNRRRYAGVAAVIVLALAVVAIAKLGPGAPEEPYSVAVVPLLTVNGDSSQAYVADGLTDQLITDLAQLGTLQVINRRTMMNYRGTRKSTSEIAKELHADAILSGTIQNLGDTVRMTAQLVLARDDRAIWAQTFEGTRGDLLRMQREAARIVGGRIRGVLSSAQHTTLPRMRPMDPEALDLYIRGRYYWNKRGPGLLKSIGLFSQALDLDPAFALAYSGMADAYVQLGYGNGLAPSDAFPKARAAAMRALELDSTLAEPHAALGFVNLYYDWNWPRADKEFKRAISQNPSYATAHEWYGLYLTAMGRFAEAQREEARAEELDPLSAPVAGTSAWVRFYSGDLQGARRGIQIVLRTDSTFGLGHLYLARMYQEGRQFDSALFQYDRTGPLRDWVPTVAGKGNVYGTLGRNADARAVLVRLDSISQRSYVTAYGVALVYAAMQKPDSAFAWLEKGLVERTNWMVWLNRDRRWDPIRSDRRFVSLTRRMRLPK